MEEQVNIPALPIFSEGVTLFQALGVHMVMTLVNFVFFPGKSGKVKYRVSRETAIRQSQHKGRNSQEKLLGLRYR